MGLPDRDQMARYAKAQVGDIVLHVDLRVAPAEPDRPMRIELNRLLWYKRLRLAGAALTTGNPGHPPQ